MSTNHFSCPLADLPEPTGIEKTRFQKHTTQLPKSSDSLGLDLPRVIVEADDQWSYICPNGFVWGSFTCLFYLSPWAKSSNGKAAAATTDRRHLPVAEMNMLQVARLPLAIPGILVVLDTDLKSGACGGGGLMFQVTEDAWMFPRIFMGIDRCWPCFCFSPWGETLFGWFEKDTNRKGSANFSGSPNNIHPYLFIYLVIYLFMYFFYLLFFLFIIIIINIIIIIVIIIIMMMMISPVAKHNFCARFRGSFCHLWWKNDPTKGGNKTFLITFAHHTRLFHFLKNISVIFPRWF